MNSNNGSNKASNLVSSNRTIKSNKPPVPPKPSTLRARPPVPPKPSTLRAKTNRLPAINVTKSQFDRFRQQFEELFGYMDKEKDYKVFGGMIQPYLVHLENNLNSPPNVYSAAKKLFKSNRYLLYLEQFITFNNEYTANPDSILSAYIDSRYYNLPIAARVIPSLSAASNNQNLLAQYSAEVYKELQPINDRFQGASRNVRNISVIYCHGGLTNDIKFCVVPDDVIIAFLTPLNKFSAGFETSLVFEILETYRTNANFLANPACYLRGDNCLQYTIYYYPGQLIPNFDFSFDTSVEWENEELGFFPNNQDENMRYEIFNRDTDTKYRTNIEQLFANKQDFLKNKITYINCCRRCDSYISNISIEFLYRYEHIINYMNISNCDEIESDINNDKCPGYIFYGVYDDDKFESHNTSGLQYFWDPVLLSTFKSGLVPHIHEIKYADDKTWQKKTLDKLKKLSDVYKQKNYFHKTLIYSLQFINKDPIKYKKFIIDLLMIKFKFNLGEYLFKTNILDSIFAATSNDDKYMIKIFNVLYDIKDVYFEPIICKSKNNIKLIRLYLDKIKNLGEIEKKELYTLIITLILHVFYYDYKQITDICRIDYHKAIQILHNKLIILILLLQDPIFAKLSGLEPIFIKFMNIVYNCGNADNIELLHNIFYIDESGRNVYIFPIDTILNISSKESIINNPIYKIDQTPLAIAIIMQHGELILKLYDANRAKLDESKLQDFLLKYLNIFVYSLLMTDPDPNWYKIRTYNQTLCLIKIVAEIKLYPHSKNLYIYLSYINYRITGVKSKIIDDSFYENTTLLERLRYDDTIAYNFNKDRLIRNLINLFEKDYDKFFRNFDDKPKLSKFDLSYETLKYKQSFFKTLFIKE